MDIASNFGVEYDPAEPFSGFQHDDVDARQRELKSEIDHQLEDAVEIIESVRLALEEEPPEGQDDRLARLTADLDEADELIKQFTDSYPALKPADRPGAMKNVLRVFTLLADHGLNAPVG
jgi:hypothetical protein